MCRSIYDYVLFRTKGRPVTQSPATPLPSPKDRRRLREAGSLTQDQVAARVGVTPGTVRAWESGRTTPRGRKREAYAKLLAELEKEPVPVPVVTVVQPEHEEPLPEPAPPAAPLTPAQAFDALYAFCAPALVRQTYLLTGRRELARESVEQAFQLAWQRWPEVAVDRDPASWVRAVAYDYALSPWHRFRPRYRNPEAPAADPSDRTLMAVLLTLPPSQRRTLLLYDGVGLDLPETAAETEASTPTTANRLMTARSAIASRLPDLADPSSLHERLTALATHERLRAAKPPSVRNGSERRARFWTRAAIAFTVALIGTTALTLRTAPTHYEPPIAPGAEIQGVPPRVGQGALSDEEVELREKLRESMVSGPERLVPLGH